MLRRNGQAEQCMFGFLYTMYYPIGLFIEFRNPISAQSSLFKKSKYFEDRQTDRQTCLGIDASCRSIKRGGNSSVCSVRSIYSGVGTVRRRSETEDEVENVSKNPKLQPQSFLPTKKQT